MSTLKEEIAYFDRHRKGWVENGHEGEWAAVHHEELLGFFPTLEDAYKASIRSLRPGEFLLRRVTLTDRVERIHRARFNGA